MHVRAARRHPEEPGRAPCHLEGSAHGVPRVRKPLHAEVRRTMKMGTGTLAPMLRAGLSLLFANARPKHSIPTPMTLSGIGSEARTVFVSEPRKRIGDLHMIQERPFITNLCSTVQRQARPPRYEYGAVSSARGHFTRGALFASS